MVFTDSIVAIRVLARRAFTVVDIDTKHSSKHSHEQ